MSKNTAWAYDPIENEDVPIECHPRHVNTDYDRIEGGTLPVVIESNFRHDPSEACQGTFTEIAEIEDGCPNCGYDRMNVAVHTLAGEHRETCRACGVDITDRDREDWEPTKPVDPVHRLKSHANYVGKTRTDGVSLYRRNDHLFTLEQHGETFSITRDDWYNLALMMVNEYDSEDDPLDHDRGLRLVLRTMDVLEPASNDDEDENDE